MENIEVGFYRYRRVDLGMFTSGHQDGCGIGRAKRLTDEYLSWFDGPEGISLLVHVPLFKKKKTEKDLPIPPTVPANKSF